MFNFEVYINFFLIRNHCFIFTELNAMEKEGSSSGSGDHPKSQSVRPSSGKPRGGYRPGSGRPRKMLPVLTENEGISSGYGIMRGDGHMHRTFVPIVPLAPPVQGQANKLVIHRERPILLMLDPSGTRALRVDYAENELPSARNLYENRNFLVQLSLIGGVKVVEYVRENGALMAVRMPNPTSKGPTINYMTDFFLIFHPSPPFCEE